MLDTMAHSESPQKPTATPVIRANRMGIRLNQLVGHIIVKFHEG
jgi:hypothetical protein